MTDEEFSRHIPRLRRLSTDDPVVAELAQDMAHAAARLDQAIDHVSTLAGQMGDRYSRVLAFIAERALEAAEKANHAALHANTEADACEAAAIMASSRAPRRRKPAPKGKAS